VHFIQLDWIAGVPSIARFAAVGAAVRRSESGKAE
jgi:hypothetical protein